MAVPGTGVGVVTSGEVRRYVETMDYPAGRDDIVREVERQGAPDGVVRAIRAMPPLDYANEEEVLRSAATDVAPELSPAERAAKARGRRHQRIAQHLRGL